MRRLNSSGAVSIISVVLFAIIVTIIALAYLRTTSSQSKNAANYDFGTRAYYAAESGVQDAVRALRENATYTNAADTNCNIFPENSSNQKFADLGLKNTGYTCQLVNPQPRSIADSVVYGINSKMINLQPSGGVASNNYLELTLRWSKGGSTTPRSDGIKTFPALNSWGNRHALLRAAIIAVPKSGLSRGSIRQRVVFLNPTPISAADTTALVLGKPLSEDDIQNQRSVVNNARCSTSDPANPGVYACEQKIYLNYSGGSAYNLTNELLYLRLNSLYASTDFEVQLSGCTSTNSATCLPIFFRNVQAEIDVTGKAGNVFRRVRQTVALGSNSTTSTWLDAALVAGEGICKNYTVGANPAQFDPECQPNAPPYNN